MKDFIRWLESYDGMPFTNKQLNRNMATFYGKNTAQHNAEAEQAHAALQAKRQKAVNMMKMCPKCQFKFSVPQWLDTQLYCPQCRGPVPA